MAVLILSRRVAARPLPLLRFFTGAIRNNSSDSYLDSYIVTPQQLSTALSKNPPTKISTAPRIIPLCAAWFLPNDPQGRTGRKVFEETRIPSARFFDLDAVKDHDSPYPHMLPTAETFAESMSELGIRRDDQLVVYDTHELGIFSAPRVAWTLKVFGHPDVKILNNFRIWLSEGLPTETGRPTALENSRYDVPIFHPESVVNFREVKSIAKDYGKEGSDNVQIIDARSKGRFDGTEPEPRPGLSSGHMPGAINLPLPELLDSKTKALLPKEKLREVFTAKGLDPKQPIISTCGTGVMAATLDAALAEADFGNENERRVYDGSWVSSHSKSLIVW